MSWVIFLQSCQIESNCIFGRLHACVRVWVRVWVLVCGCVRVRVYEHLLLSKKMELDAFFGLSFESDEKILNDENEKPFQPNLSKKNLLEHHHFE